MDNLDAQIVKFSGFSKSAQNRLSSEMFADIHDAITVEKETISLAKLREFFLNYFDFDPTALSNGELKQKLTAILSPYTERSSIIYDEMHEITTLKKQIANAIDECVFESFELQSAFFSFLHKKKIHALTERIQVLSPKIDTVNEALHRRARWSMDLIIGDYYILYMMFYYLYYYILEHDREDIRVFVTQNLNNLVQTVHDSVGYYNQEDAKVIHRFVVLEFDILKDQV
jgi:uncharacterized membrane protein YheB (UPF0754 family)